MNAPAHIQSRSPYATIAGPLRELGYSPIPIGPGTKKPGAYVGNSWDNLTRWTRYCAMQAPEFQHAQWERWPDAGVGIAHGFVVAVDVDTDRADVAEAVRSALPIPPARKRGRKGYTGYFRPGDDIDELGARVRFHDADGTIVLELLLEGSQSVIPPSIHPDTGEPYRWIGEEALEALELDDNPVLDRAGFDRLTAELEKVGVTLQRPTATREIGPSAATVTPEQLAAMPRWRQMNTLALQQIDAWFPALGLHGTKQKRPGHWQAVPEWRASNSGRAVVDRNPNLSAHQNGIVDFGTDDKFSAVDLVMRARGCSDADAFDWLESFVDLPIDDEVKVDVDAMIAKAQERAALEAPAKSEGGPTVVSPPAQGKRTATPFEWVDPASIPRRPWVYGRHLIRQQVSVTVAPGGVGKSSLTIVEMLAMVTGRGLLGDWTAPDLTGWIYNLEDPRDEMQRRIAAAMLHYQIAPKEVLGRLYIDTGREQPLTMAEETPRGTRIITPVMDAMADEITARGIDVLVIDPFVSSHQVGESDNGAIDLVAKEWARLADRCNCAIELVHHTRKLNGEQASTEDSRGAVALLAAARSGRVLNRMSEALKEEFGIAADPSTYFAITRDKANLSPPGAREWRRVVSVDLHNSDSSGNVPNGDTVGVVEVWQVPDAFDGVTNDMARKVQTTIRARAEDELPRSNVRASDWVGHIVGDACDIDTSDKAGKRRAGDIVNKWIKTGVLKEVEVRDARAGRGVNAVTVGPNDMSDVGGDDA